MSYQDVRGFYEDYEDPAPCDDCYGTFCSVCEEIREILSARDEAVEAGFPLVPEVPRLALLSDFRDGKLVDCPHGHGSYPALLGCDCCEDLRIAEAIAWSVDNTDWFLDFEGAES